METRPKNEPKQFIDFYNNLKYPNCGSAKTVISSKDSKYVTCKNCNEKNWNEKEKWVVIEFTQEKYFVNIWKKGVNYENSIRWRQGNSYW